MAALLLQMEPHLASKQATIAMKDSSLVLEVLFGLVKPMESGQGLNLHAWVSTYQQVWWTDKDGEHILFLDINTILVSSLFY